jgi:undecaprenyl-diphosphatase
MTVLTDAILRLAGPLVLVAVFALRALEPGLAGLAGVPYGTFAAYNVAGGVVWATGAVLLGFAAGAAWRTAERVAGGAGLVLAGVIVVGAAAAALLHRRRPGHRGQPASERSGER